MNDNTSIRWCILTVRGGNTLALAYSLKSAGFDAWTPVGSIERRRPRTDERNEKPVPITPTFVFVNVGSSHEESRARLSDLWRALNASLSPHPNFGIFQYGGSVPLLPDRALDSLREEEVKNRIDAQIRLHKEGERLARVAADKEREAALMALRKQVEAERHVLREKAKLERERAEVQRQALQAVRSKAPRLVPGDEVISSHPIAPGSVGVVQSVIGHEALVLFGGKIPLTIEAWMLHPNSVGRQQAA